MDWDSIFTQTGMVVLKEGLNFVFSRFRDRAEAEDAKEREEVEAQIVAERALEVESEREDESQISEIRWEKVATLYWLGNDLMWVQDMMYRGALPARVLQGVNIAMKYCKDLGFDKKSFPVQQLAMCETILDQLKEISDLTPESRLQLQNHYGTVNHYMATIKWYLTANLERQQPDFEKIRAL